MLKKYAYKKILLSSLALFVTFLMIKFPNVNTKNDEVVYSKEKEVILYMLDQDKYLGRISFLDSENSKDEIRYIASLLTVDENNQVLNSLIRTIPMGTKVIDYEIDNKILKINFSKELLNISVELEEKMISSIIYTYLELDNIDKIIIFVEGNLLDRMPISNKKLNVPLDRSFGINNFYNISSIKGAKKVTTYYKKISDEVSYYVPITNMVNTSEEPIDVIVSELKSTPVLHNNLISYLNASYELDSYELKENQIIASFNSGYSDTLGNSPITEEVKLTMALSLRDTYFLNNVIVNIN